MNSGRLRRHRRVLGAFMTAASWLVLHHGEAIAEVQDARSMALGGARLAVPESASTAWSAPALLALESSRSVELSLPAGVSVGVGNDFLGFQGIDRLLSGATLSDTDVANLLSGVNPAGLGLSLQGGLASALSIPAWHSGVFVRAQADTYGIALPKDVLSLLLGGNANLSALRIDSLAGARAEAYADAGLSLALPIPLSMFRHASLGVTGRYLQGLWMGRISEARGSLLALGEDGTIESDARARWQVAGNGGRGWALDTQLAFDIRDDLRLTTHVANLGTMTWSRVQDRLKTYQIPKTAPISFEDGQFKNRVSDLKPVETETAQGLDGLDLTENLPLVYGLGLAWKAPVALPVSLFADAEVGQARGYGASTVPRFRTGLEIKPFGFLPLRLGYGAGGEQPTWFSAGFGIDVPFWRMDASVVALDGMFGAAKGAMYALSSQLQF